MSVGKLTLRDYMRIRNLNDLGHFWAFDGRSNIDFGSTDSLTLSPNFGTLVPEKIEVMVSETTPETPTL